jgi:hypothetical protein
VALKKPDRGIFLCDVFLAHDRTDVSSLIASTGNPADLS